MRFIFVILILAGSVLTSAAQQIKPYQVIVKTLNAKQKGILYKADSAGLGIDGKNGFTRIKSEEIRSVKVRAVKKNYKVKKFVKYDPWDESQFERNPNGVPLRKWAEKDPTLKEEITGHIGTSMMNAIANVVAAPIHAINPSIARMRSYSAGQIERLSYYSIHYQANPDKLKELEQLKSIGKAFKAGL